MIAILLYNYYIQQLGLKAAANISTPQSVRLAASGG
jgi:hypothetical protein